MGLKAYGTVRTGNAINQGTKFLVRGLIGIAEKLRRRLHISRFASAFASRFGLRSWSKISAVVGTL
jgi:hypothetical protein